MCSIFGVFSKTGSDVSSQVLSLLESQKNRGSDGFGFVCPGCERKSVSLNDLLPLPKSSVFLGHTLLSTTGFGLQPFTKGFFSIVHNGQIYNYDSLVDSKGFSSDSESIAYYFSNCSPEKLVFFVKNFMQSAVGEYAVGLFSGEKLFAFRDFLGFKPLWFGENESFFAFASQPSALMKLDIFFPKPLLPGHLLEYSKQGLKVSKVFDLTDFRKSIVVKPFDFESFSSSFDRVVSLQTRGLKKAAVLFSGGVDSSLIAKSVSEKVPETVLFVSGLENSADVLAAEKTALLLGLPLVKVILSQRDVERLALKAIKILSFYDEMQVALAVPLLACVEKIKEMGFKVVFSGQGSDELFCGYSYYSDCLSEKGYAGVEDAVWFAVSRMWHRNLYRDEIIVASNGLELRTPFLLSPFLEEALSVPVEEKIKGVDDSLRKHPVRLLAKHYSLPSKVVLMKKKSLQYGSGCQKIVSKLFSGKLF